jgi:hypothetical protein
MRSSSKWTALAAALVLVAIAAGYVLTRGDDTPAGPGRYVVDRSSVGGKCSDDRPAGRRPASAPWCSLERAVEKAPAGSLVLVRRGSYGPVSLKGKPSGTLRFKAYPGERVSLGAVDIPTGRLRIEGFRITGGVNIEAGAAHVALVRNRFVTDGAPGRSSLNIGAGARRILVAGNQIAQRASVRGSNAINFNSTNALPPITAVTIRDNGIGPVPGGGDAIQAKHTRGLVIEHNDIFGVRAPPGSGAHPDAFQSIYGATDLTIKDNFIHDIAAQGIFLQEFQGENRGFDAHDNVIARVAYPFVAFSANAAQASITHNTVDGVFRVTALDGKARVLDNIATFGLLSGGQIGREDYNLAQNFTATKGPHSIVGKPQYRDITRNDYSLAPGSPGYRAGAAGKDLGSRRPAFRLLG